MAISYKILFSFVNKIYNKEDITTIYNESIKDAQVITPDEVFRVMNELLKEGKTAEEVLSIVDKVINVLYKKLSNYAWEKPKAGTFLFYLIEENNELKKRLEQFKALIKKQNISKIKSNGIKLVGYLEQYNIHLLKLENILFPAMEKKHDSFLGLSIMWELHDNSRNLIKKAKAIFIEEESDIKELNKIIGKLYFQYYGLIQKQSLLMFPAAQKWIDEHEFEAMHAQSFDLGFAFIEKPKKPGTNGENKIKEAINAKLFQTNTGTLNFLQLNKVLSSLPLDITVVDENDKVIYFSDNDERIFPRAAAIIGRKVQNCHPPKSLSIVEGIINSFKENKKDSETFWINIKGKTVLIKYLALRDDSGKYLGTLEISQDITEIKNLEGEKRLFDSKS